MKIALHRPPTVPQFMPNARTIGSLGLLLLLATAVCSRAQTWSLTGSMAQQRIYLTATLLPNGQVIVVGGYHRGSSGIAQAALSPPNYWHFTCNGQLEYRALFGDRHSSEQRKGLDCRRPEHERLPRECGTL